MWASEESKPDLVHDLRLKAEAAVSRRSFTAAEIELLAPRPLLGTLGAEVSGPKPERTVVSHGKTCLPV